MTTVALDIETVRQSNHMEWWLKKEVKAPKNYKDPDKIKAYVESEINKLGTKSALTWHTGKMFSFSVSNITREFINGVDPVLTQHFVSLNEASLLNTLSDLMAGVSEVWGKSSKEFDFPFLVGRYLANNLPLPAFLTDKAKQKDIDDIFSYSRSCSQRLSLNAYAHGLGLDPKSTSYNIVDTAYDDMVLGNKDSDSIKELEEYNNRDAEIVAHIVRRFKQ